MCLATTMKVVEILPDSKVKVEMNKVSLNVSTLLFPQIQLGDYVLIHAGFIIGKVSEEDAKMNLSLQEEIEKMSQ